MPFAQAMSNHSFMNDKNIYILRFHKTIDSLHFIKAEFVSPETILAGSANRGKGNYL